MNENKQDYLSYLSSEVWKQKARRRLDIDKHRCQMCGSTGTTKNPLEVHHLTYRNLGNENIDKDLVTLCRSCHFNLHNMMNRVTNSLTGQRGWKDTLTCVIHTVCIDGSDLEYYEDKGSYNHEKY